MATLNIESSSAREAQWLRSYYFVRAAFSAVWVVLAFFIGTHATAGVAVLLVIYPAWDAFANFIDMSRSGGAGKNRTQAVNIAVSAVTTVAVFLAVSVGAPPALEILVFGRSSQGCFNSLPRSAVGRTLGRNGQ